MDAGSHRRRALSLLDPEGLPHPSGQTETMPGLSLLAGKHGLEKYLETGRYFLSRYRPGPDGPAERDQKNVQAVPGLNVS